VTFYGGGQRLEPPPKKAHGAKATPLVVTWAPIQSPFLSDRTAPKRPLTKPPAFWPANLSAIAHFLGRPLRALDALPHAQPSLIRADLHRLAA